LTRVDDPIARFAREPDGAFRADQGFRRGWVRFLHEAAVLEAAKRFEDVSVERPPFWGGYRIAASSIEFWQNRDDRLHDRWLYERDGNAWRVSRLGP
jgi:pyridoxamine 5'-phosphate oxidase